MNRNLKTYIAQAGKQATAAECVIYRRDESGMITRIGDHRIQQGSNTYAQYVHEEKLTGWPENRVFWADETGPSIGAAPLKF